MKKKPQPGEYRLDREGRKYYVIGINPFLPFQSRLLVWDLADECTNTYCEDGSRMPQDTTYRDLITPCDENGVPLNPKIELEEGAWKSRNGNKILMQYTSEEGIFVGLSFGGGHCALLYNKHGGTPVNLDFAEEYTIISKWED